MDHTLFAKRLSVRKFKPDTVPPEVVRQLICAAIDAPSAGNCQPWHFYAVTNEAIKERLCLCSYGQPFMKEAPLVIVVCAEPERSAKRYAERGRDLYSIQDTAAAIENILLCAVQSGLGSCWCGAFDEAAAGEIIGLPADRRPVALLAIGYPEREGKKPSRRPLEEVFTALD